jgi:hypothetical protein
MVETNESEITSTDDVETEGVVKENTEEEKKNSVIEIFDKIKKEEYMAEGLII